MIMEMNGEMSEMRSQIALLKRKIDGEKLLNERLVSSIVRGKLSMIRRENVLQIVAAVIMIPFCGVILTTLTDSSLAFIIVTELLFTTALLLQWYANRGVSVKAITDGNLAEAAQRLVKLKRFKQQQLWFGFPIMCLWLVWFYFEVMQDKVVPLRYVAICLPATIFCVVYSVCRERKQRREIDEMMSQIDELTRGE